MTYAIIQSKPSVGWRGNKEIYAVIRGERAPGGYPVGVEGVDWEYTYIRDVCYEDAVEALANFNQDRFHP